MIENFDNEKEKPVVSKKILTIEDFVSFCTGSRYITRNLMWARTIDFQHFEQDSSPGVRVAVNTCNLTLTFPVNGRYNLVPEQFLKNIIYDMWVTIFIVIMKMGVSVAIMQVVLSAVHYAHDCFYCNYAGDFPL